jgi:hypothetical protein
LALLAGLELFGTRALVASESMALALKRRVLEDACSALGPLARLAAISLALAAGDVRSPIVIAIFWFIRCGRVRITRPCFLWSHIWMAKAYPTAGTLVLSPIRFPSAMPHEPGDA